MDIQQLSQYIVQKMKQNPSKEIQIQQLALQTLMASAQNNDVSNEEAMEYTKESIDEFFKRSG